MTKKDNRTLRQVNIEPERWKPFNILLLELDLRKMDFAEDMFKFFYDKQGLIHNRASFEYPRSIPRSVPHEVFQMKCTPEMMEMLLECLENAKKYCPDQASSLSERRVLKAMFDEYVTFLEKQKR